MFSASHYLLTVDCTAVLFIIEEQWFPKRGRGYLQHCHVDGVKILHSSLVLVTKYFASVSYLLFLGIYICMCSVTDVILQELH